MNMCVIMQNKKICSPLFAAYLKLVAVIFIWGASYHVAKYMVSDTDIYTVSFLRFIFASICLMVLYYKKYGFTNLIKTKSDFGLLFSIGVTGLFLYNLFFFGAEALIPANDVAILYAFTPCITVLLASVLLKQRINLLAMVGILIALMGTISVVSFANPACSKIFCSSLFEHLSWGQCLALLAVLSIALFNILNRKAASRGFDALAITTIGSVFACILLGITFVFAGKPISGLLHKSITFWMAMMYFAVFTTVVGYVWYSNSIKILGVGPTSVFQNGVPFAAILIGMIFAGEPIAWSEFFSGLVIIAGVLITNFAVQQKKDI